MRKKIKKLSIDPELPVYTISVVSELVHIPIWTLRILDEEDICCPKRTQGKMRLYSNKDLQLLDRIHHLMDDEGVNINGIRVILDMLSKEIEKEFGGF